MLGQTKNPHPIYSPEYKTVFNDKYRQKPCLVTSMHLTQCTNRYRKHQPRIRSECTRCAAPRIFVGLCINLSNFHISLASAIPLDAIWRLGCIEPREFWLPISKTKEYQERCLRIRCNIIR